MDVTAEFQFESSADVDLQADPDQTEFEDADFQVLVSVLTLFHGELATVLSQTIKNPDFEHD